MSLTPHERRRWDVLVDRAELGESLTDQERDFVEVGAAADPTLRAELEGWDRMVDLLAAEVGGELVDAEEAGLAAQVLATHRHRQASGPSTDSALGNPRPNPRPRRALIVAGAVSVLSAAAAILMFVLPAGTHAPGPDTGPTPTAELDPIPAPDTDTGAPPTAATPAALPPAAAPRIAMLQGGGAAGSALAQDRAFGPGCLVYEEPWVVACTDGRVVRREAEEAGRMQVLELREGTLHVTLDHLHEGRQFVVGAGATRVTAVGTTFAVELAGADAAPDAPEVTTSVLEGVVEVTYGANAVRRVTAGQAHFSGDVVSGSLEPIEIVRQEALGRHRAMAELWRAEPRDWGYVALEHDPERDPVAAVVDGHAMGPGALTIALAAGPHAIASDGRSERVELSPGETTTISLAPRRAAVRGPSKKHRSGKPAAAGPSAASLLADARAARKAGRFADAAALYEALIEQHPDAPESRPVRVQLGDLRLSKLDDAKGALEAYRAYLASGGVQPLAPEARYGVVRALRKLGRESEEREAIDAFLRAHPADWRGEELRRRLGSLPVD